ncbi:Scr1 family TA system antitoxin-like transcriptional regulator [Streptomyces sp. NPDC059788]|uniref:Scr1 family TA system antitoxin-like transcriptional regulator n=1 Tax=Streptomyces sp. NPDC059788 TaxID=3346948 RepID=UPI0036697925
MDAEPVRLRGGGTGQLLGAGFGPHVDLDVVHTEGLTSALYIEEADKVAAHRDAWQRLTSAALPVGASADLITEIRKNT